MDSTNSSDQLFAKVSNTFHIADYVVFAIFMLLSVLVGVFFSVRGNKQRNVDEYILGDRKMSTIPTGISLGMSFMSAITVLGNPAEMFINGYIFSFTSFSANVGFVILAFIFIRYLHSLQLTSPNEYFEKRFNSKAVLLLGNMFSTIGIMLYMGICLYAPAIAINVVTGGRINTTMALAISGGIGTFYTLIGGLKAVVWSDVLQSFFLTVAVFAICIRCLVDVGGFKETFDYNVAYKRFDVPDFSLDPRVRHSFWGVMIGACIDISTIAISPAAIQRMWAFPSRSEAYKGFAIGATVMTVIFVVCAFTGLVIFAFYTKRGCDIYEAGYIDNKNDIITYYIMERMNVPGFPGMFAASLYAGALSSFSSGLNAVAATVWKDILQPNFCSRLSDQRGAIVTKVLVLIAGVVSIAVGFLFMKIGGLVMQMSFALAASIRGPYLGFFVLSLFFPCVHHIGLIVGSVISFVLMVWINIGAQTMDSPIYQPVKLPYNVDNCAINVTMKQSVTNMTNTSMSDQSADILRSIYSISYLWYTTIGLILTILIAMVVTLIAYVCCKSRPRPFDRKYCVPQCYDCMNWSSIDDQSRMDLSEDEHNMQMMRLVTESNKDSAADSDDTLQKTSHRK